MHSPGAFPEPGQLSGPSLFPEGHIDPFAPLMAPLHWLAGTSLHVAIGLLAGVLAAWAMRSKGLRWTWAALGVAVLVLVRPLPEGIDWTLATAAAMAALIGRRMHNHDIDSGGDLLVAAASRVGPIEALRIALRKRRSRRREAEASWLQSDELVIGCDARSCEVRMPLGGPTGGTHTLVVGAAGSGKTVTQTWIAVRAIERGLPAVVIDPKDDPDLHREIQDAAARAGKQLIEWSPDGPTVFNPFAQGTESEIADKVLMGERFTEPHYQRQAQRFLGHEVRALRAAGLEVSLAAIATHLDPDRLELLLRELPEEQAEKGYEYVDSLTARQRSDLSGVRDRLAIMVESDIGRWIDPETPDALRFDLRGALREEAVVLFRLQSDTRPLLMKMLGAAIVEDLSTTMASFQRSPVPSVAVIDEFAAIASEQVGALFGRARGAGMSLVLGTQELSDLEVPGRETLRKQVIGSLTTAIAHRQVVPESTELVSELAGRKGAWRRTMGSEGRYSETRTSESPISAETVRSLGRGCAAVIVFDGPLRGANVARMHRVRPAG